METFSPCLEYGEFTVFLPPAYTKCVLGSGSLMSC